MTALDRMSETSYSVTFYKIGKLCHISTNEFLLNELPEID